MDLVRVSDPDGWIDEIFAANAVARGGVIRRDLRWIDREIGRNRFVAEVKARGFHLVETGGQWVVICNRGFFRASAERIFWREFRFFAEKSQSHRAMTLPRRRAARTGMAAGRSVPR